MTVDQQNEIAMAVLRGAERLDQHDVLWAWKVDMRRLAMWMHDDCPLGQLHGCFWDGMFALFPLRDETGRDVLTPESAQALARSHGFLKPLVGPSEWYDLCQAEWLKVIRQRREPSRVLVSAGGETLSARAAAERNIVPNVVFIRQDGWTLGAPWVLNDHAYHMGNGEWVLFMLYSMSKAEPIANYVVTAAALQGRDQHQGRVQHRQADG